MMLKSKAVQVVMLLAVALAFGGGGSAAGLANLTVQLTAMTILAFNSQAFLDFFRQAPRLFTVLVGTTLLLPLLQSIPLPAIIWQSLPGRTLVTESLALFGREDSWFPMSLEVRRTLLAFLSLLPPLTILVLAWNLPEAQKRQLLLFVAAAGGFVVLLGTQQLATGNRKFVFFDEAVGSSDLQGMFANRNSAGLFLNIALCALIGAYPRGKADLKWTIGSLVVAVLLVTGLVLTRSRSSMALVIVPLSLCAFRFLQSRIAWKKARHGVTWLVLSVALLAGGAILLLGQNSRIQHSISRFDYLEDRRPLIWADTLGSIKRFWPTGSGIGTFDEVFQIDETLENVRRGRAARAHNEYLEVSVESGLIGILLLLAWCGTLAISGWKALRSSSHAVASSAVLVLFALQSISDYPLRSQTLLCIAGLMLALLTGATYGEPKLGFHCKAQSPARAKLREVDPPS